MFLIFDTETTGLPRDYNAPVTDTSNWPRVVQIAWQLHDANGACLEHRDFIIKPEGYTIPFESEQIHGISTALAEDQGVPLADALAAFTAALNRAEFVVGQNIGFDLNVVGCEFVRLETETDLLAKAVLDTCTERTAELCRLPGGRGGKFKLPTLSELHKHLFGEGFNEAHNATADVEATTRCFFELVRTGSFTEEELHGAPGYLQEFRSRNPEPIRRIGLKHRNLKEDSARLRAALEPEQEGPSRSELNENARLLEDAPFGHLHNHTQFSILQATTDVDNLVKRAAEDGHAAVAMTDLGNMMGAFQFVKKVAEHNKSEKNKQESGAEGEPYEPRFLKPIVGAELYLCRNRTDKSQKDDGYPTVFLAKNKNGYHNLAKLSSEGYISGFYYVPRIDRELLLEYKEDIMVLSGGLQGEIASLILNVGEHQAEEALLWWKEHFGDDFYLEIGRHGLPEEDHLNQVLLRFANEHNIKVVAANNTFYLNQSDAEAHDILLCVKEGERKSTPIGRGRGYRYGFPNDQFYFKSAEEMKRLFLDLPEAILNIRELTEKVEPYELAREVLLPKFSIPEEFINPLDAEDGGKRGENAFLRHLTYEGAYERYGRELPEEVKERLDFELATIERTGYPGYFLIVQDFCREARNMGVSVGPGRGSAAGSAVAYCIGITNVDPIAYDLLFERFLNPDRISLPDIDIDFDDRGRDKVINYVIEKYGSAQVAQIITYGSMAAKSSIKDAARVLELPFESADKLTKLMPDNVSLSKLFGWSDQELKENLRSDDAENARQLREIINREDPEGLTLRQARVLEGSLRNTGIHACGVIITPSDIRSLIPVATAKDSEMWCTQFDNAVVESAGLLKMDFLGLKTLTIIKDALAMVKERIGEELDIEAIPLDDAKTYELFQRGDTVGIFQYESPGMQKYLKELKPTVFADLIAMNALYRPGPLEYIPSFIRRKHGEEEITYDLEDMQEFLEETYGITVYQEQVMLLSQKLAGFTKGEADQLRKAMGKKIKALLEQMKPKFINGGAERGHPEAVLEKVWKDWEAFASYAFNKSHSTCYAKVAYQTAYLKAHYPAEYMAAVLSNNLNDIKQVTFFMEECKRMGVKVLGPDVNESRYEFTVNPQGEVRFGLGGMKGVGASAVGEIVEERKENGPYRGIFDLLKRVDLRVVNRRTLECLALGGAFDGFEREHRALYFHVEDDQRTFLEKAIRYAQNLKAQEESAQVSLFGDASEVSLPEPALPAAAEWTRLQNLKKEKEITGIYLSSHPLDDYKTELEAFTNVSLGQFQDLEPLANRELSFAGIVVSAFHGVTRRDEPMGGFVLEDYSSNYEFRVYRDDYLKFKHFFTEDLMLMVRARVEARSWTNQDGSETRRVQLRINHIQLLQEVMENQAKLLQVFLGLGQINPDLINSLETVFREYPGNKKLRISVVDGMKKDLGIDLSSRSLKVQMNKDLFARLRELGVGHRIQ